MATRGYEQCPKCGAWRQKAELVTHIHVCTAFRCPQCGMSAHDGHQCINNTVVYRTPKTEKNDNALTGKTADAGAR